MGNVKNKTITKIGYNYLGLPEEITLTNNRWIRYYYDGSGGKYKKVIHQDGLPDLEVHYQGDLIYHKKGNLPLGLYSLANDEGRVLYLNNDWVYEYQYKDHLGNLRVAFREKGGVAVAVQVNAFDPWGNSLVGINQEQGDTTDTYLYQGYEREYAFGLNLDDAVARFYDPQIGRMHGIDQVDHHSMSSYAAMGNNPVSMIDPDGRNPIAIGFMVGMFASSISHAMNGTMPSGMGDFLRPGLVGAASAGVGSGVATLTTAWGTVGSGIASGAAGGFVGGGLDAAYSGGNILVGAGRGALGGAAIGGVMGMIQSEMINNLVLESSIPESPQIDNSVFTDGELRQYVSEKFANIETVENTINTKISLATMENLPKKYTIENNSIVRGSNKNIGGVTVPHYGWFSKPSSRIYIAGGIKGYSYSGNDLAYLVIGHELIHAYHYANILNISTVYSERAAYSWSISVSKSMNFPASVIQLFRMQPVIYYGGWSYPEIYSWRNIPFIRKK